LSNIVDLFKRKRVVGWNSVTGRRTANSLRKEKRWPEMMADLMACETRSQLLKCGLYWSNVIEQEKWPIEWETLAHEEFDIADKAIEALAAQQAE
jgi:hypothetical protein